MKHLQREINEPIKDVEYLKKEYLPLFMLLLSKATDHRRTKRAQDIPWNRENKKDGKRR